MQLVYSYAPLWGSRPQVWAACRLGEPVTLCWRLERSQAESPAPDSVTIQYDVQAGVSPAALQLHYDMLQVTNHQLGIASMRQSAHNC